MKFDVVYTWVNGGDPDYMDLCRSYAHKSKDTNPERYRDNFQLLKYSLRSLETYFNSFNNVFILTARPQIPEWCNLSNKRLKIVHHDEVIPDTYLPAFNSNSIETFLHRIPGLSDNFLYMNDDFLFGNPVNMDSFYKDGKYRVYNTMFGENLSWRIYDGFQDIIGLGIIEHSPMMVNKHYWEKAYRLFPEQVERTRKSKFRDDKNICPYKLYRYYMLRYKKNESLPVKINELNKVFTFHKLMNNVRKQRKFFNNMKISSPKFYCLNDDLSDHPDSEVVSIVKNFLQEKYAIPSSFERHPVSV